MSRVFFLMGSLGAALLLAAWLFSPEALPQQRSRALADYARSQSFSDSQVAGGAVVLYIIGIIYVLAAIQVITNEHISPLIEVIMTQYNLNSDVARATLLGLAGSAPELCICFIGTLLADSDIGVGNVLGSGALNAMFLTGLCAIIAKTNLEMHWWPLARDFLFNSALLIILSVSLFNELVSVTESTIIVLLYIFYSVFMFYNERIEKFVKKQLNLPYEGDQKEYHPLPERPFHTRRVSVTELEAYLPKVLKHNKGVLGKISRNSYSFVKNSAEEGPSPLFKQFKHAGLIILRALEERKRCKVRLKEDRGLYQAYVSEVATSEEDDDETTLMKLANLHRSTRILTQVNPSRPLLERVRRWMMLPVALITKWTIPRGDRFWFLKGFLSFLWIAFFAYLAVWWCHVIAVVFNVHDSLLGMVFLAPGTTFPDLYNTVQATMQGKSEVALSSSVSSNILNISMGLGVPWFIYSLAWGEFHIQTGALFVASCVQIGMVFVSFLFIGGFKWQLSNSLGKVMFVFYLGYLLSYLLVELLMYSQ